MKSALVLLSLLIPAYADAGAAISGRVAAEGGLAPSTTVYLEKAPDAKPGAARSQPVKITQKNSSFAPGSAIVKSGEPVEFPNEDKIYHNVFSLTPGNEFDLGLYRGGVSKNVSLKTPGEVDVYCNIHPDMVARILVVEHDYWTIVAPDGTYSLKDVPPGSYTLIAWSPDHEPERKEVVVSDDAKAEFSLKSRKSKKTHLNKYGEQYGRYK